MFKKIFQRETVIDETFSSIELITECLSDTERTTKLISAIEQAVKPGDIVIDSGTGSTILAMAAARAGAKKVYALEIDPYVATLAKENLQANKLDHIVEVVEVDAREVSLSKGIHADVVIMEMLTTGMIDEHQVITMNRLHERGLITKETRFMPRRQDTYVALTNKNFEAFGFIFRMVRHLWSWLPNNGLEFLSEKVLLNSISFDVINPTECKEKVSFVALKEGVVNSVHFSSKTILNDELELGDTLALNAPVAFPLPKDIVVKNGETISLEIGYIFGGGYWNVTIEQV